MSRVRACHVFFMSRYGERGGSRWWCDLFSIPHGVQHMSNDTVFSKSAGSSLKIGSDKPKRFPFKLTCCECHRETTIKANPYDVAAWRKGQPIQQAMPYLTADQRELFISGICGKCYDELFCLFESVKP